MIRFLIHYSLHILAPGILARFFFQDKWIKAWIVMLATMLIDLDHLLATPIFDPCRCSIGFHPLHSVIAIGLYVALLVIPRTRILAVGLLFHIFTDSIDCLLR